MKDLKAVLKVFQTGAITITAPNVNAVQMAVERIYPLIYDYRKPKPSQSSLVSDLNKCNSKGGPKKLGSMKTETDEESEPDIAEEEEEEEPFSDSEEDINPDDYSDKSD